MHHSFGLPEVLVVVFVWVCAYALFTVLVMLKNSGKKPDEPDRLRYSSAVMPTLIVTSVVLIVLIIRALAP